MVKYIFLILTVFSTGFSRIRINDMVGDDIDSCEASFYRLFRDVRGFISAQFYAYEKGDSVLIEMLCLADSAPVIMHRNIDRRILESLDYYTLNFRGIVENRTLREEFVKDHVIDWPIVTPGEIRKVSAILMHQRLLNSICCVAGATATAAYIGAILGKDTHQHTGEVSCFDPISGESCSIPVKYDVYTVDKKIYLASSAAGLGAGYLLSNAFYKRNILSEALRRDIAAFDDRSVPITNMEVAEEDHRLYAAIYGTLGCAAGIAVSAMTAYCLFLPWSESPDNDLEWTLVAIPIVTISAVEGLALFKASISQGQKIDRLSAIERIRKKRIQDKN